jgi:hypothetical protein
MSWQYHDNVIYAIYAIYRMLQFFVVNYNSPPTLQALKVPQRGSQRFVQLLRHGRYVLYAATMLLSSIFWMFRLFRYAFVDLSDLHRGECREAMDNYPEGMLRSPPFARQMWCAYDVHMMCIWGTSKERYAKSSAAWWHSRHSRHSISALHWLSYRLAVCPTEADGSQRKAITLRHIEHFVQILPSPICHQFVTNLSPIHKKS